MVVVHVGANDMGKCSPKDLEVKFRLLDRMLKTGTSKVVFSDMLLVPHAGPASQVQLCALNGFGFVRHWKTLW